MKTCEPKVHRSLCAPTAPILNQLERHGTLVEARLIAMGDDAGSPGPIDFANLMTCDHRRQHVEPTERSSAASSTTAISPVDTPRRP